MKFKTGSNGDDQDKWGAGWGVGAAEVPLAGEVGGAAEHKYIQKPKAKEFMRWVPSGCRHWLCRSH